jgi:hypothetical protein
VIQEIRALLCAYYAERELVSAAAAMVGQDPLRICYINAPDVVHGPGPRPRRILSRSPGKWN